MHHSSPERIDKIHESNIETLVNAFGEQHREAATEVYSGVRKQFEGAVRISNYTPIFVMREAYDRLSVKIGQKPKIRSGMRI